MQKVQRVLFSLNTTHEPFAPIEPCEPMSEAQSLFPRAQITGADYANLVALYVARRFESRGLKWP